MEAEQLVAIYIRVSSDKQAQEGYSLKAQETVLRQEAVKQNKEVFRIYCDAGLSGARPDRPALQQMLRDAEKGLFGHVWVWKISRISRNLLLLLKIHKYLEKYKINFYSISENIDLSTASGKMIFTMLGNIAQLERDTIRENSRLGSKRKVEEGKYSGVRLLGYDNVYDPQDKRGATKLQIDLKEAELVKNIYILYSEGKGFKAIVNLMNEKGYVGKNGSKFSINTIKGILTNQAYIGKVKYAGKYYDGVHQPIISKQLWDKVQSIMKDHSKPEKTVQHTYLLAGLLKCPQCHKTMIPTHTYYKNKSGKVSKYYYYTCGSYMNKGRTCCRSNSVRAAEIEKNVLSVLIKELSYTNIKAGLRKNVSNDRQDLKSCNDKINKMKERKKRLQTSIETLLSKYESGRMIKERLLTEMQNAKEKITEIERQLSELKQKNLKPATGVKKEEVSYDDAVKLLKKEGCEEEKAKVIKCFVKAVYIDHNRQLSSIEYKLPQVKEY